ncbi:MAG: hydrogenase maturation nickel metallochaperone HypA/HybF [Thermoanaerobaculia bacterium]
MHEYSIIQSLVDSVKAAVPPGAAVHRIDVRIGEVSGVDCELLSTAYEVFRAGTLCDRATMTIDRIPARWECSVCGAAIARGAILRCATCGGAAHLAAGDEIILQRIEMEVN